MNNNNNNNNKIYKFYVRNTSEGIVDGSAVGGVQTNFPCV